MNVFRRCRLEEAKSLLVSAQLKLEQTIIDMRDTLEVFEDYKASTIEGLSDKDIKEELTEVDEAHSQVIKSIALLTTLINKP